MDITRANGQELETTNSRRRTLLKESVKEITSNGGGLRMSENLSREDLYDQRFKNRDSIH